jgi:ABC-type transport system involved in cytochrome bd biosynthesis fused ATPase/permease subunit
MEAGQAERGRKWRLLLYFFNAITFTTGIAMAAVAGWALSQQAITVPGEGRGREWAALPCAPADRVSARAHVQCGR